MAIAHRDAQPQSDRVCAALRFARARTHDDLKSLASKRSTYYLFAAIQNLFRNVLWGKG